MQGHARRLALAALGGASFMGVGMVLGIGLAGRLSSQPAGTQPPSAAVTLAGQQAMEQILHASTAASGESFALATGLIDQDAEGVYLLDFATGELKCMVLNHLTRQFSATFATNVTRELGVAKNPSYLMVTGEMSFPRGGGMMRPALSVVYVVDSSTGNMVAYGIPWHRNVGSVVGQPQIGPLVPLDAIRVRNIAVTP
jgi:hypothetical protein